MTTKLKEMIMSERARISRRLEQLALKSKAHNRNESKIGSEQRYSSRNYDRNRMRLSIGRDKLVE